LIGHTLRKENNNIGKTALDWNPQGHRKKGKPRQTWKRSTLKEAEQTGKTWQEIKTAAQNRVRWTHLVRCTLKKKNKINK